jgi:formate/nitrite transporter FocA (FNT family)
LNVLTSSAVLFNYIFIQLGNFVTGAVFLTMCYQYLIQVCCM